MTTYTFNPQTIKQSYSWNDPSIWNPGVVPNSPDADVIFPVITANGSTFFPNVGVFNVTVNSISLINTLLTASNLTAAGSITVLPSSQIHLSQTLSAGSLTNQFVVSGSGQINVSGLLSNQREINGNGLTLTAFDFNNTGSIAAGPNDVTINVTHSFSNLVGSTLTGGTYQAGGTSVGANLYFNVGGVITNDAANINLSGGEIAFFDSASSSFIPIETSLTSIAASGSLSLAQRVFNWTSLTDAGLITIGINGTLNTPQLTVTGDLELANGILTTPQLIVDSSGHVGGAGTINGSISNAGVIAAEVKPTGTGMGGFGDLVINSSVTGAGHFEIGPALIQSGGRFQIITGATLELNTPVSQNVVFDDSHGTLTLGDPTHFTGAIDPLFDDKVILPGIGLSSITSYSYSGDAHGGTLTLQQSGGGHLDLKFTGVFEKESFTLSAGQQDLSTSPPSLVISGFTAPALPNNPGNVDEWILKDGDGHWLTSAGPGSHPAGFRVAAVADFNGDGFSDMLWQNVTTGAVDLWKIRHGGWAGSVDLGRHPGSGWQIAGAGDFNHDGTNDIFWFNPGTGETDIWQLANGQWAASVNPGSHPVGYQVAGIADFNRDGTSDVLWLNPTTRDVDEWNIVNGHWAGSNSIGAYPTAGYQIAGVGDFNGDGTGDVFWFNPSTGATDIWLLQNGKWSASVSPGNHPAGWNVAGIGDFNGDGTSDLLWYNPTTRATEEWLMANGHWAGTVDLGVHPGSGWNIAGIGDFNGGGTSDVLWHQFV